MAPLPVHAACDYVFSLAGGGRRCRRRVGDDIIDIDMSNVSRVGKRRRRGGGGICSEPYQHGTRF